MVKVLFDMSTSKEVMFFRPMKEELERRGHHVSVVSRRYTECNWLIDYFKIPITILGRHGGNTLWGKLAASGERVRMLADFMKVHEPDVIVTLSNPEVTRAGFGLKIPVVCFNDIPEAEAVARLTIPLASWVLTPWIIPKTEFTKYGISEERIFQYNSLDPVLWLKRHTVSDRVLKQLKLDPAKPIVVYRKSEVRASYVDEDIVPDVIRVLDHRHPPPHRLQVVEVPRYEPHEVFDVQSLLSQCNVFIGGGGTMSIEAAYYGTPVIDCRLTPTRYLDYLSEAGLSQRASTVREAVALAEKALTTGKNLDRAREVFVPMSFPLREVTDIIVGEAA